jgi:hypothetical protein
MAVVRVPYQINDRQFGGMIVYDDTVQRKRPIVFMQPDWKGGCPDTVAQARIVATKEWPTCSVPATETCPRRASNLRRE